MSNERWHFLMKSNDAALTVLEILEGWHWCPEMDGLLANYNDPNGDCFCELKIPYPDEAMNKEGL